ncbi:glycoside hydrolase family 43 protein [Niallia sp. Man26]|uniref:glycoside hydrolase family 43 protein n=1 Tax=Niallia sp. Man26 TaxID=2912824 RepID=UPI001EDB3404|nr:glycoside hydrolase family 43 protein [Niallia sp. Man26]UPO90129.1 glycoside hydrolase family 43 protein [Niallia sp. Man26]
MIVNPILRGFNPDASVVKVGSDYYLATSTFEWWPGVEIYHSTDLVNWNLVAQPINRISQANLVGNYNSGSIWAPHLSYSKGKFWLLYTDVKTGTAFKDTINYVISCETIDGEWSEPTFVTASGFDPAFFHDEDGRHYVMNMLFDHRLDKPNFSGLVIQEYDLEEMKLIGERSHFFRGTDLGVCEGPQLLKKDGWYYLLCAAGGTGYSHASTVCRSKNIFGPYELSPFHPLITTKTDSTNPLQKSGHASFVPISEQEWYIVHLCSRPLTERGNCTLGRETALQKIEWIDGWPRLVNGTPYPEMRVPKPSIALNTSQNTDNSTFCNFNTEVLPNYFKTLRRPLGEKASLIERPGYLRLYGEQSLSSLHQQSLVARRWQSFRFRAETEIEFSPKSFQQLAGLVLFYDTDNWIYLHISYDEERRRKYIQLETAKINQFSYESDRILISQHEEPIKLAVEVNREKAQFYYNLSNEWIKIGEEIEVNHLSDDYIKANGKLAFTGAMVGICAQDMDNHTSYADFKYFNYQEISRDKLKI